MDLVHILAFQTLKFWRSLRQSSSSTLKDIFMCFRMQPYYMSLLKTYSCATTDSFPALKYKVHEHYSHVCVEREAFSRLVCV